jgi:hypothetical protein
MTRVPPFYFACALKRKLHLRFKAAYLIVVCRRVTASMWFFGILRSSTFERCIPPVAAPGEVYCFRGKSIRRRALTAEAVRAVLRCGLNCVNRAGLDCFFPFARTVQGRELTSFIPFCSG